MAESKIRVRIELELDKEDLQKATKEVMDATTLDASEAAFRELVGESVKVKRRARRETVIDEMVKSHENKATRFREELSRRWRPWATYIQIGSERAWPSGSIVACTGSGLTTAASTARKILHEVRDCPRCGGDGSGEWHGERVHLTRARKKWECEDCSAGIKPESLYVVLGLYGSPVPKVIGKWPDVRRLCVECWQRI